jgi:gliding motility-associated-like protein
VKVIGFLFFLGISNFIYCQNEANFWYFGTNAGIRFDTASPVALTDGKLSTSEGCATMSNSQGKLLFYTDGITVWDYTHTVTPNGVMLKGDPSSTQSALILLKPGSDSLYYILTVDRQGGPLGIKYSMFDITLNSGHGDIDATKKNVSLVNSAVCEKLTAVRHANGRDFWIMVHLFDSEYIYAYLLTETGISSVPVRSKTGYNIPYDYAGLYTIGYMKLSPNGSKIAYANTYLGTFCVGDFDKNTGVVSNVWSISMNDVYGVEFSPNSNFLYVSSYSDKLIMQYDCRETTKTGFINSGFQIAKFSYGYSALQLGPDQKIYVAAIGSRFLDVIHLPDSFRNKCKFEYYGISLSSKSAIYGLPNFVSSIFRPEIKGINFCHGSTTKFSLSHAFNIDSVHWSFDDPNTGKLNYSRSKAPSHVFSKPGTYNISTIVYKLGASDTLHYEVLIKGSAFSLGNDTIVCKNSKITLGYFKASFSFYEWNDKSNLPAKTVDTSGVFSLKILDDNGCYKTDTIRVSYVYPPEKYLGNDTFICVGSSIKVDATENNPLINYLWSTNETTPTIDIKDEGKYWILKSNVCGQLIDTIKISHYITPLVNVGPDEVFCDSVIPVSRKVKQPSITEKFQWSTGRSDTSEIFTLPGQYWLALTYPCGMVSDTFQIVLSQSPKVDLGKDTSLCGNFELILDAGNPGLTYFWQPGGEQNQIIYASKQQQYSVNVFNAEGCFGKDTIKIKGDCESKIWFPNSFTPNGDLLNEVFRPLPQYAKSYQLRIYNRWGEKLFESKEPEFGWDGTYQGEPCQIGQYFYESNFIISESSKIEKVAGTVLLLR